MKFLINIFTTISSIIFLVACSATSTSIKNDQQSLVGENVNFTKSSVSTSVQGIESEIRSKVFSQLSDKSLNNDPAVVNKVNIMIKAESGYGGPLSSRLNLKGELYRIFDNSSDSGRKNIDKVFVHNKAWTHANARVNYERTILKIQNESGNDTNGVKKISLTFGKVFAWGGGAAKGQGEVILKAEHNTDNNGIKYYNFSVISANAETAKVMGFKTVADISFDLAALRDILGSIQAEKSKNQLIEDRSSYIANNIIKEAQNRYYSRLAYGGKIEEIYGLPRDVAKSRLDRRTNIIRSGSSYVYVYKGSNQVEHNGKSHKLNVHVELELFPESSGRTAVIYQPQYEVIYDKLSVKTVAGEEVGRKWVEKQIAYIRNLLKE